MSYFGGAVANSLLWKFNQYKLVEFKSKQAERMYKAAVEQELNGEWTKYAVGGSVRVALKPTPESDLVALSQLMEPYDTDAVTVERNVREKIARIRARLSDYEHHLDAYGGSIFVGRVVALHAPNHPFNAEAELLSIMRMKPDAIWIHGIEFRKDRTNSFVRV